MNNQHNAPPVYINNVMNGAPAKRSSTGIHLLMTALTLGAWLPVWIVLRMIGR